LHPEDPAPVARADALDATVDGHRPTPADEPLPSELSLLDEALLNTPGGERVEGVVDRFFADKGFGFLRYGDGNTLFFHVTQCEDEDNQMMPGTRVSFVVGHNPKKGKPQAEAVRRDD
jgi:cold shock CspA family protein